MTHTNAEWFARYFPQSGRDKSALALHFWIVGLGLALLLFSYRFPEKFHTGLSLDPSTARMGQNFFGDLYYDGAQLITLAQAITPTNRLTETVVPTPTWTPFVVTATPTPETVLVAATRQAQATLAATTTGTATAAPANLILATHTPFPLIVTSTPTAASAAIETAIARTTGTAERNRFVTATPTWTPTNTPAITDTPIAIAYREPTAPTATTTFPTILLGKIMFLGDLDRQHGPEAYYMDADGANVMRLTSLEFYQRATERDSASSDRRFHAFVRRTVGGDQERQIFVFDHVYGTERQITHFGDGSTTWDPAWSPTDEVIAVVSNVGKQNSDEIWVVRRGEWPGQQLTDNNWAWDKHPSWSPDGRQIWIMDADGDNQRQLTNFATDVWDPVWVKYTDQ
ncbi:MAG: hypothetical protein R3E79_47455 [Caldilineaceae bacterium]